MAVTVHEAGAVFVIKDQATASILKIARAVLDLNEQITGVQAKLAKLGSFKFTGISANVKKLDEQFAALAGTVDKTAGGMTSAADAAAISVRNLSAAWANVARSAASAGAAARVSAGGGGSGRGGRGGVGITMPSPNAGGVGIHGGGPVIQAAAGALLYGGFQQATLDDLAYRAIFTAGVPRDQSKIAARMNQFKAIIKDSSIATGASISDEGAAALNEIRLMAGIPWAGKMAVLPEVLRKATGEARLKGTSIPEAASALIGMAHMTQSYNPKDFGDLANKFSYLSTMVPVSVTQMERAFGYNVPQLMSYGYNRDQVMMADTMLMRAGILNSKSGTWIRQLATEALPGTTATSRKAFELHEKSLQTLGLVDAQGKPTFLDKNGNPDLVKLLKIAGAHINALAPMARAGIEKQVFGTRGAGALAVLSNPTLLAQLPKVDSAMENFNVNSGFFEQYAKFSEKQQAMQTWQQLTAVMMDLSNVALPPLIGGLQQFDNMLKDISKIMPTGDSSFGKAVGKAYGRGLASGNPVMGAIQGGWGALQYWLGLGGNPDDQKKAIKQGTKEGAKEGVEDALKHPSAWWGPGIGGGGVIPASFTGGGGFNNGVNYSAAGAPNYAAHASASGGASRVGTGAGIASNPMGGTILAGPRGGVNPTSLYQNYVSKFRSSKLSGFVPKDGAKWGIKTGSPEEWARLALATSRQESSLNPNAVGGGLNQFQAGDLKRWGVNGAVNDPNAQAQALVNQWTKDIPLAGVVSEPGRGPGTYSGWGGAGAYFGSMRFGPGSGHGANPDMAKYMPWANKVAAGGAVSGTGPSSVGSSAGSGHPRHYGGTLTFNGQSYKFGTGGLGGAMSAPYGTYPITPGTVGAWGAAHGAIGLNNNKMWDALLGRNRNGIEMHGWNDSKLLSEGCIAIPSQQWKQMRGQIMSQVHSGHSLFLHLGPHGASIDEDGSDHTHGSSAIARFQHQQHIIHNHVHLDGKQIAQSTAKHMVQQGNMPQQGARLPDYTGTRRYGI